jgi:hypothetical protein
MSNRGRRCRRVSFSTLSTHLENPFEHTYLEKDRGFLLKGDAFTRDFPEAWFSHKRKEADAIRLRPRLYEFFLSYAV